MNPRLFRMLVGAAILALIAASLIAASGGGTFQIGPIRIRSHDPRRPALAGILLFAIALAAGRKGVRDALAWWWLGIERRAQAVSVGIAAAAAVAGIAWGTFVAGGSDSYCYLNQAELFARGEVRVFEPLARDPAWPGNVWSFAPAGHNPAAGDPGYYVAICPAGYSLLLAGVRIVLGRTAMFWVTPILGGIAVYLAFLLAGRAAGPSAGVLSALLTGCSPIVLYQIVQPMNDIPAAAFWTAALVAASWRRQGSLPAVAGGILSGLAITIRPNLFPLCAIVAGGVWLLPQGLPVRDRVTRVALFSVAAIPGVVVVLAMQAAVYGTPLSSGYGDLSALFSPGNVVPNLERYPRWLIDVHTPVVLAALAAPAVVRRGARLFAAWLLVFTGGTLVAYLPYVVFDAWWYLRFLLPAIPSVLALTSAVLVELLRQLSAGLRTVPYLAIAVALAITFVTTAVRRDAFRLQELESRFRIAGEFVAGLPSNAVVITNHHAGSVRFYSGRLSAGWSDIEPGRLDEALEFFRARGLKPYLLLEDWEVAAFRGRFSGDRLGKLDWPEAAELEGGVHIFDPETSAAGNRGQPPIP